MKPPSNQRMLAMGMLEFVQMIPESAGLDWTKDDDYLYFFEAARFSLMLEAIVKHGLSPDTDFDVLDAGYLHGLVPEFIHRAFPKARITVIDHPKSPNFDNKNYKDLIAGRDYLNLVPLELQKVASISGRFNLIILGEIIEHLDPTDVTRILQALRGKIAPDGMLLVTTPNAVGIFNAVMAFTGRDRVVHAPIPNPVMGYGHIHLWSPWILQETAAYCGFKADYLKFFHGREDEMFARSNRHFESIKHYVWMKLAKWIGNHFPSRRGFFVASFRPA